MSHQDHTSSCDDGGSCLLSFDGSLCTSRWCCLPVQRSRDESEVTPYSKLILITSKAIQLMLTFTVRSIPRTYSFLIHCRLPRPSLLPHSSLLFMASSPFDLNTLFPCVSTSTFHSCWRSIRLAQLSTDIHLGNAQKAVDVCWSTSLLGGTAHKVRTPRSTE
jgi:hypothetical protein